MLVLFAGLLPDPTRSVASTSIAFNTYGITYMPFLAESIAVSTRYACSRDKQHSSQQTPLRGEFICRFGRDSSEGCLP